MNAKASTCPSVEVLADYGLGKLDSAGSETIYQHLETCVDCRLVVASLSGDSFVNRLRDAQAKPPMADASAQRARTFVAGESIPNLVESSETSLPAGRKPDLAGASLAGSPSGSPRLSNVPPELANHSDYEFLKELGHGGMGVVYLARNRMMDRLEVLKVVSKSLLDRPGALERFQQEIRSAAKLAHPNIVAAYSVLRPGDLLVFAMEYVEGQDLSQVVKQRGPLPVTNATFYAQQTALGLQHAHDKGMVHRDIKPNNLMLAIVNKKHVVKILDFGLAKATSEKAADGGLTKSGQMLGTPDYIAPEQTLDAQKADIRADIYSLGCTLYYLLSGKPPFTGNSLYEILHAHHQVEANPLNLIRPEAPVELAVVVSKMMAKDPAKRFQTPMEVAKALNPFFKAGAQVAKPELTLSPSASLLPQPAAPESVAAPIPMITPAVPLAVAQPIPVAASPLTSFEEMTASPAVRSRKKSTRSGRPRIFIPMAIGLLLAAIGIAAGVIFKFRTADGMVAIEVNEPNPEIYVDGNTATVAWEAGGTQAEIRLPAGSRKIEVKKDGFKATGETVELERGGRSALIARLERLPKPAPIASEMPAAVGQPTPAVAPNEPPKLSVAPTSDVTATTKTTYLWPPGTPPPAIAPFDAKQARAHQEAWAKHLGVPIEQTNSIGMKLVLIPPGEFMMGSPESEEWHEPCEGPQHRVRITRPFYLGDCEVTQTEYEQLTGENPSFFSRAGGGKDRVATVDTGRFPVEQVSWEDATTFCQRLGEREKVQYRLPSEAEWEYACRAGSTTQFSFGENPSALDDYAWYEKNPGGSARAVGLKARNAFGLYDMHGNVREWCQDWYAADYYRKSPEVDPPGPPSAPERVNRGSAYDWDASGSRSAFREQCPPEGRYDVVGFRVVRVAAAAEPATNNGAVLLPSINPPAIAPADVIPKDRPALKFNGRNTQIVAPHIPLDSFPSFTIEAWVRGWKGSIVLEGEMGDPENSIWLSRYDTANFAWESDKGKVNSRWAVSIAPTTDWEHLALVYASGKVCAYVNGKAYVSNVEAPRPGTLQRSRKLILGGTTDGDGASGRGSGELATVRISTIARYQKNFTPEWQWKPDASTALLYDAVALKGKKIIDLSPSGRDGVLAGFN